ncbi:MAG: OsmC family peroxiredoxin [Chloroflexia bacterium]|jgi:osmotically inducible protein OsmC|nr:OsmC family peroxiredoxin [Chloroflexia bacterium]
MAVTQRSAKTVWNGDLASGSGTLNGGSGAISDLGVTWAARTEESGGKTSPEELIASAHSSCYAMAFSNVLSGAGHAPDSLEVTATVDLEPNPDGGVMVTRSALNVVGKVSGLSEDQFAEYAKQGEQGCPISNLIRNGAKIELSASLK